MTAPYLVRLCSECGFELPAGKVLHPDCYQAVQARRVEEIGRRFDAMRDEAKQQLDRLHAEVTEPPRPPEPPRETAFGPIEEAK